MRREKLCGMANLSVDLSFPETSKYQDQNTRNSPAMIKLVQKVLSLWHACVADQTVELMCLQIHSQLLKHGLSILPLAAAAVLLICVYQSFPPTTTGLPSHSCSPGRFGQLLSRIRLSLIRSVPWYIYPPPASALGTYQSTELETYMYHSARCIFHPTWFTHEDVSRVVVVCCSALPTALPRESRVR